MTFTIKHGIKGVLVFFLYFCVLETIQRDGRKKKKWLN